MLHEVVSSFHNFYKLIPVNLILVIVSILYIANTNEMASVLFQLYSARCAYTKLAILI